MAEREPSAESDYDKACRYAAKLDPVGLICWLLGLAIDGFRFGGWLDTRNIPFPGQPNRTCDTVARLERTSGKQPPWAIPIEFQIEPDFDMTARLMAYLGAVLLEKVPDPERGSRFYVGGVIVNLTGTGNASRQMEWPEAGLTTNLGFRERNLATMPAEDLVNGIEAGKWSRYLLVWVPLMAGAGDSTLVDRWIKLAETEPSSLRRADLAFFALLFADRVERGTLWQNKLRGWNVEQSALVSQLIAKAEARAEARGEAKGRAEGRAEERVTTLLEVLTEKFGTLPPAMETELRATTEVSRLRAWTAAAVKSNTLEEFRQTSGT